MCLFIVAVIITCFFFQEMVRGIHDNLDEQLKPDERYFLISFSYNCHRIHCTLVTYYTYYSSVSVYNKSVKHQIKEEVLNSPDGDKYEAGLVDSKYEIVLRQLLCHSLLFI